MSTRARKAAAKVRKKDLKKSVRVTKTLSLDGPLYAAVKKECQNEGVQISSLVEELLKAWLEEK